MKPKMPALALLCAMALPAAVRADETTVDVRVLLKERAGMPAVPFAGVGGFRILRGGADFKEASCPDASNQQGTLTCTITCNASRRPLQLSVRSPNREVERKITAYTVIPATLPLEVRSCSAAGSKLEFVFKTQQVLFAELKAASASVFAAISADDKKLKPLSESASALVQLARDDANRDAILLLSRIATSFPEGASEKERAGWKNLDQYAVGAPSIVVSADAAKSSEKQAQVITADPATLNRSLGDIESRLSRRQALTEGDKKLYNTVKTVRATF